MKIAEFGDRVGISEAYASRLKNGLRVPSAALLDRIGREFKIPAKTLLEAYAGGAQAFSALLRARVYKEPR